MNFGLPKKSKKEGMTIYDPRVPVAPGLPGEKKEEGKTTLEAPRTGYLTRPWAKGPANYYYYYYSTLSYIILYYPLWSR